MVLGPWIYPLRTIIINGISIAVAAGLWLNGRRNREVEAREWHEGESAPRVEIIVPARDEARNIGPLLRSLLAQRYPPGRWGITLVDDGSSDGTAEIAEQVAKGRKEFRALKAEPLPQGWTGKSHALNRGCMASPTDAEWLLLVDADTRHHTLMLPSMVRHAQETGADLLSLVIHVRMGSFWERVLVPQVGELYTLLVGTMDGVNRGKGRAAANGQFILVRRALFAELGKLSEVRSDIAEDRALAHAARSRGHKVRLDYGRRLVSARVYSSLGDMWSGYAKTLFWASGHDMARALLVVAALTMYALLPVASLLNALFARRHRYRRVALRHAAWQLLPMLGVRAWVCRRMGVPLPYALTYPLGVAMCNVLLLYSIYRVRSGRGVRWKGRTYR